MCINHHENQRILPNYSFFCSYLQFNWYNSLLANVKCWAQKFELARIRTWNLLIRSQTRYPLRHEPKVLPWCKTSLGPSCYRCCNCHHWHNICLWRLYIATCPFHIVKANNSKSNQQNLFSPLTEFKTCCPVHSNFVSMVCMDPLSVSLLKLYHGASFS